MSCPDFAVELQAAVVWTLGFDALHLTEEIYESPDVKERIINAHCSAIALPKPSFWEVMSVYCWMFLRANLPLQRCHCMIGTKESQDRFYVHLRRMQRGDGLYCVCAVVCQAEEMCAQLLALSDVHLLGFLVSSFLDRANPGPATAKNAHRMLQLQRQLFGIGGWTIAESGRKRLQLNMAAHECRVQSLLKRKAKPQRQVRILAASVLDVSESSAPREIAGIFQSTEFAIRVTRETSVRSFRQLAIRLASDLLIHGWQVYAIDKHCLVYARHMVLPHQNLLCLVFVAKRDQHLLDSSTEFPNVRLVDFIIDNLLYHSNRRLLTTKLKNIKLVIDVLRTLFEFDKETMTASGCTLQNMNIQKYATDVATRMEEQSAYQKSGISATQTLASTQEQAESDRAGHRLTTALKPQAPECATQRTSRGKTRLNPKAPEFVPAAVCRVCTPILESVEERSNDDF